MKQIIVIRKDLKMRRGKEIAQGAHAAVGVVLELDKTALKKWQVSGMKKICCQVNSEEELLTLHTMAMEANIPCYLVTDAGLTELPESTITCLAVGPDNDELMDNITGNLSLY